MHFPDDSPLFDTDWLAAKLGGDTRLVTCDDKGFPLGWARMWWALPVQS
jgi:hypothetical protein